MAVSMLAGCFGGGNKNYSDKAADAANAAQSTVVFATDTTLAKSLQDALADGLTQLDEIDDAMEADENLKPLLTSGWDLDIFAAQGEDAEAAAKTIAEQYIVSAVIGKKAEGKIAMVLHDGNGYYYVAVLTYGGGSGSGGGAGGGSGSGEGGQGGGTTPGTDPDDPDKPGPDDNENNPGGGDDDVTYYSVTTNAWGGNGHYSTPSHVEEGQELSFTVTADKDYEAVVTATMGGEPIVLIVDGNRYTYGGPVTADIVINITFAKKAPEQFILNMGVNDVDGGNVYIDGKEESFLGDTFVTAGEDFTFTVTPNDNYEIEKVTATRNGESRELSEKNGTYTVEDIQSDVKVLVTFAEKAPTQYMVNVSVNDTNGGTVSADIDGDGTEEGCLGNSFVNAGDDFDFTVTPAEGYEISSVTVERGNGRVETLALTASNKYTASKIESDTDITVTFAPIQVTVTLQIEGDGDGTVTFNGESIGDGKSITVDFRDEVIIKATAGTDSELVSISDGSNNLKNEATIYPSGNITITVTFESTKPVLTSIDVKQTGTIYVDDKISGSDLTVTAYDQNGKEMEVTLKFVSADPGSFGTAGIHENVSVTYKDKDGKQYTDKNVTITVTAPYVTGIEVTTSGNIVREYRANFPWEESHSDTVFKLWTKNLGKWHSFYCDDITITVKYAGQKPLVITEPDDIKKYVEAGQLTATPEEFEAPNNLLEDYTQPVTISYKDSATGKTFTDEIDVTVTWIKLNT